MACGLRCASRGGEGAHLFRKHGVVAVVRHLFDCSQCPNCLREYHTCGQLQIHLRYSAPCREALQARRLHLPPVAGIGSTEERQAVRQHDGLLPPLQAQGPHLPAHPPVRQDQDHVELLERLVLILEETPSADEVLASFEEAIRATPISWTQCSLTLQSFKHNYGEELAAYVGFSVPSIHAIIDKLSDPEHWPFLRVHHRWVRGDADDLEHYTSWCSALIDLPADQPVWTATDLPRPIGAERVVLHAFAGRRRLGDYQWFLEDLMKHAEGVYLTVVSLDLVIDERYGDLSDRETQEFWLHGIRQGWVHSFLGGPTVRRGPEQGP